MPKAYQIVGQQKVDLCGLWGVGGGGLQMHPWQPLIPTGLQERKGVEVQVHGPSRSTSQLERIAT